MSADPDGDSTMHSGSSSGSEDLFPDEEMPLDSATNEPSTPRLGPSSALNVPSSELSPPNSQGRAVPTSTMSINSNGKRVATSILGPEGVANPIVTEQTANGVGAGVATRATTTASAHGSGAQAHRDPETGYEWTKEEDAPGYAWMNRKAQDEYSRAWKQLLEPDRSIGNRYGDPLWDEWCKQ